MTIKRGGVRIPATMYALILAGGKGERLRPLTDTIPKPMVPISGKPILAHQVHWLRSAGVTDVIFLVGYLGRLIEEYFGDGTAMGIRANYSYEESPLGRGGALRKGLGMMPQVEGPVIATNGDVITGARVEELIKDFHQRSTENPSHMATVLTVPMVSPYGIVDTDSTGRVSQFREKATLPYAINGGFYVLDPKIEELLPDVGDHETTTFPELAESGRMSAVQSTAFWRSVDSFKDLSDVEEYLARSSETVGRGTH